MRVLRFFSVYFFLSLTLLIESTWKQHLPSDFVDTFVYTLIIPIGVASFILLSALVHEHKMKETKKAFRGFLKVIGTLGAGTMLSLLPALTSYWTNPTLGFIVLFIILPGLYILDRVMEGS
ncbi:hypothetical protein PFDSM3638_05415 [Pyrococcus furiosus DSM 3638]|uniref:DUF1616 domain-containing protein n=3 Tax=Pyrococcus furiosus TaxID=2261 RepID=A0A5C0XR48_PYRFU|nr:MULTISPECIES: hypothetical protein [Pyrococcus]AAL81205.1 hypothetical protein PF1081 [Pyrococcus furiosus DSM 3638]AFN03873.1 hypothetical protein PFC_04630 [Pyrococcus furiosus COM1]MDK2868797.1 hypothetical protein [Pyrococcus sp.]QEK78738.1 hypothetical protein PFDSM3638_05415 [Pyrococcus furiosus DSM 3638]